MKFNINEFVKVELTEKGEEVLRQHYLELIKDVTNALNGITPMTLEDLTDTDEYYKFQLWELMNIFGKHLFMGGGQMFVNNEIEILEEGTF